MARRELGNKCACDTCNERFYDLNRSPAICPKCGAQQRPAVPRSVASFRRASEIRGPVPKPEPVVADAELEPVEETEEEDQEEIVEEEEVEADLEVDLEHATAPE